MVTLMILHRIALIKQMIVTKEIEHFSEVLFQWFYLNYMKISSEKHLMLLSGNDIASASIDNSTIIHGNENARTYV